MSPRRTCPRPLSPRSPSRASSVSCAENREFSCSSEQSDLVRAGSFVLLWRFSHLSLSPSHFFFSFLHHDRLPARESVLHCCCMLTQIFLSLFYSLIAATARRRHCSPTIRRIPSTAYTAAKIAAHLSRTSTITIRLTSKSGHLCVKCAVSRS